MKENPDLTFWEAADICVGQRVHHSHAGAAGLEPSAMTRSLPYIGALGLTREQFHDLGRENMGGFDLFSLPVMALKLSTSANGVSKLHGKVSRHMWQWMFRDVPENEIPIDAITNGIHIGSWISSEMAGLFDRYLDPAWREEPDQAEIWADVDRIPDAELWRSHERRRERLVSYARRRLREQLTARGATQTDMQAAQEC